MWVSFREDPVCGEPPGKTRWEGRQVGCWDQNSQEIRVWHILQSMSPSVGHIGNQLRLGFLMSWMAGFPVQLAFWEQLPRKNGLLFPEQIMTFDSRYIQWVNLASEHWTKSPGGSVSKSINGIQEEEEGLSLTQWP